MPFTQPGLTDQSVASGGVDETVDEIQALAAAELTLSSVGGSLTADGNEQNLYYDNEPLGVFAPVVLIVDVDNMEAADTIVVKVYHRMSDAGGLQLFQYNTWSGVDGGLSDSVKLVVVELYPNRHGYRITLQQTAGTNRAYPWELYVGV